VKLFIYHSRAEEYGRAVAARFPELEIIAGQDAATLERGLAEAEIIMASRVPTTELGRARCLRWIQLTSAGADHLVPIREDLRNVVVTNASGIHGVLVADYVFGVLVMLQWRFPQLLRKQAAHQWGFQFTEPLAGKTLGLVGLGSIGSAIAQRAGAFGMRVIGMRRSPAPVEGVERVLGPGGLSELVIESDVVVLVVPKTGETRGLIGEAELRKMRRTAFLINVSRGAVVDEPALLRALREGWIAGAALDVFAEEPLPAASPFWDLENVIVTPHIAGEPLGYTERVVRDVFADNLVRFRAGQPLQNVVDLARGY
jgi:phosphoglycerate dehydrogenase-like enzyme